MKVFTNTFHRNADRGVIQVPNVDERSDASGYFVAVVVVSSPHQSPRCGVR